MSFSRSAARRSRFASLAKALGPARDWIFGVVNFGSWVVEPQGAYQPLTIFWLTPDGRPLLLEPVAPQQLREKAVESFYRVAEDNKEFGLPARVRVRVAELHQALAAGLPPQIDVVLTSTPEADLFIENFSQVAATASMKSGQKLTKLTQVVDLPEFCESAALALRMQPWLWLSEQDVFTISGPELGIPWAGLVASQNFVEGEPALLLFMSCHDAESYPRQKREKSWTLQQVPDHIVLTFREASQLDSGALKNLVDRGWDASNALAPVLVAYGPSPEPREPTHPELTALNAVLFAFTFMFVNPNPDLEGSAIANLFAARLRIRMAKSGTISSVDLSIPFKALDRICEAAEKLATLN